MALPVNGVARIAGGDTLLIHSGQYKIGLGAPETSSCSSDFPWDCSMAAVPSGKDAANPTRILGEGYNAGCGNAPELWGTQRVGMVLNMRGSSNVQLACVAVTDHSPCVESHSSPAHACKRDTYPFGDWAGTGIYAQDSTNVTMTDVNVHGMANRGIMAGRLKDWTLTRVRIAANGWSGWEGDLGGGQSSSNSGTMKFSKLTVEWNGCGETYPGGQPTGCWGQSAGGYGDGMGTGTTGGTWIFEDSAFLHNVSDGLDLLYADGTGSVTINRVHAEGNAGNQLKVSGQSTVTNSLIVGNCGYFDGKPFTYVVDSCRALGDVLVVSANRATQALTVANNTILSQGNVILLTGGPAGSTLKVQNNIMIGAPYYHYPASQSADLYIDGGGITVTEANSVKQGLRNMACTSTGTFCGTVGVTNATPNAFDARLLATSPAIGRATSIGLSAAVYGMLATDQLNLTRGLLSTSTTFDVGALKR